MTLLALYFRVLRGARAVKGVDFEPCISYNLQPFQAFSGTNKG